MANSVDPDQSVPSGAVWSGSTLFAYAILSHTLGVQNFRILTILKMYFIIFRRTCKTVVAL